jgi:hypothetical protein
VTFDGRITAWLAAWQCLEGIDKHRAEAQKHRVEPDGEAIRKSEAQAAVYARLAQASPEVGYAAGEWLKAEEQRRIDEEERREKAFADLAKRRQQNSDPDEELAKGPWQ